jgi:transposase InsO family protein
MDTMEQKAKIILAYELVTETNIPKRHICEKVDVGKSTLYRWLYGIKEAGGLRKFLDVYECAKKGEREKRKIDPFVKRWIWRIREEYRGCCGQKIQQYLLREKNLYLSVPTIYAVLAEKYILRTKWRKNQVRGHIPKAEKPGEVVQMDTVDLGNIFAFTGVDIFTKAADVLLSTSLTSKDGYSFLRRSMNRRFGKRVDLIQTDGGPEFKDVFKQHVLEYADRHRVARPYKKNEQSYIESFNRSLRKECLGWGKYRTSELSTATDAVEEYLEYYHTRRLHCALNYLTPLEFRVSHI